MSTTECRLRRWHPEDAAVLYAAVQDEEIARQLPPLETEADARAYAASLSR